MNVITKGWIYGFIGVLIFSGSLPATRVAVGELDPYFLTVFRAAIAGLLSVLVILILRAKRPEKSDIVSLIIVALGVVIGFPLLTALALEHNTSAHAIVFLGLLPLSKAIFAVIRGGERPSPVFWVFSVIGSLLVAGFAFFKGGGSSLLGDFYMLISIIVCGLGYAEGAKLSRKLGNWQVISSWALVLSLPFMAILTIYLFPSSWEGISMGTYMSLAYVSLFSMYIGFVFWYRGLSQGGIASVGQLQLLQPFFGLLLAAVILQEEVGFLLVLVNAGVVFCVAAAKQFSR
ncbi:DMT family transporter [Bacillus sp. OK048]|uniref:DMT family transporter n=1 Tax=Bacillus sp. OK048 TaxID=1882761 RepID=UPI000880287F|nr:DMT family transporter [Bacillus sp. OK048]SDN58010.1 EamA-like transporter family protein [Bacillus sp. OK048]